MCALGSVEFHDVRRIAGGQFVVPRRNTVEFGRASLERINKANTLCRDLRSKNKLLQFWPGKPSIRSSRRVHYNPQRGNRVQSYVGFYAAALRQRNRCR
jgi:hypothetical protein